MLRDAVARDAALPRRDTLFSPRMFIREPRAMTLARYAARSVAQRGAWCTGGESAVIAMRVYYGRDMRAAPVLLFYHYCWLTLRHYFILLLLAGYYTPFYGVDIVIR